MNVFNQKEYWIGSNGEKTLLEDLSTEHLKNIIKMLMTNRDKVLVYCENNELKIKNNPFNTIRKTKLFKALLNELDRRVIFK